jgi:hypothetical protein
VLQSSFSVVTDYIAYPIVGDGSAAGGTTFVMNFGQDSSFAGNKTAQGNGGDGEDFYYTPPTGYKALNTDNLPDSSIALPNEHFNTVLYTGDGSTQSITGVSFQPNFVWIKSRNQAYAHALMDSVRGSDADGYIPLSSNNTALESAYNSTWHNNYGSLDSLDANGFTVTDGPGNAIDVYNASGVTYVAWNWKSNGSGVSNTDGTITSTVSANTTSGFSIVKYTGTGVAGDTMGHGLSQAPEMVIMRKRISNGSDGVRGWHVWTKDLTDGNYLALQATNAQFGARDFGEVGNGTYPYTAPTSSLITFGGVNTGQYQEVNYNGDDYIMYCFHSVEDYSKIGKYTGNGSTDGTFVYTGFKPQWILVKQIDATRDWIMYDNKRSEFNVMHHYLHPNLNNAEGSSGGVNVDFLSNGFKWRSANTAINVASGNYIYLAFAESPFKYSNAR